MHTNCKSLSDLCHKGHLWANAEGYKEIVKIEDLTNLSTYSHIHIRLLEDPADTLHKDEFKDYHIMYCMDCGKELIAK
jgi:hypothetical protein